MRNGPARRGAFSLVEVTIAIGLVGFCLVALFGLFSVGLKTNRQATSDTILASASSIIAAELQAQGTNSISSSYYFDHLGIPTTNAQSALFVCQVSTNLVPNSEISGVYPHLVRAKLTFTWPFPNNVQTQAFYVTLPSR